MELYFASMESPAAQPRPRNLVTFAIPDIGVSFKAPYEAEDMTLEYASLLTLLEFRSTRSIPVGWTNPAWRRI